MEEITIIRVLCDECGGEFIIKTIYMPPNGVVERCCVCGHDDIEIDYEVEED